MVELRNENRLRKIVRLALIFTFALLTLVGTPSAGIGQTLSVTEVPSNWSLNPTGLTTGDQFRLLLVSKNPMVATSTDISDYDNHLQNNIRDRGHGFIRAYSGNFKVLGSTATTNGRTHTGTTGSGGVPIYWINGSLVANDYGDFYDGSWSNKRNARWQDGKPIIDDTRDQVLCTGTNDNGTTSNLPLGGADPDHDGVFECSATTINTTSNTLSGITRDVTDTARYIALSGVFEVGNFSIPLVTDVEISSDPGSDGEYAAGDDIQVSVTFSEAVAVSTTGTAQVKIKLDKLKRAQYSDTESTATKLVFSYQVGADDFDHDGISLPTNALELKRNATVQATDGGTNAILDMQKISASSGHKVHVQPRATGATVSSTPANGAYFLTGETIVLDVAFDRNIRVITTNGTPSFEIQLGSNVTRDALFTTLVGDRTMRFEYDVQSSDIDQDGFEALGNAIDLNGGQVTRKEVSDDIASDVTVASFSSTHLGSTDTYKVNPPSTEVDLSVSPATVDEDADATSVTVTAALDGAARSSDTNVTVVVGEATDTATEGTDYASVSDVTLTITADQTSGTAMFTLTPTNDTMGERGETISVSGSTSVTGLSVTGTTIAIIDDDPPLVVDTDTLTVEEDGSDSFNVRLATQPTADVTVGVTSEDSNAATVNQSNLTFTAFSWNVDQTVTVSGVTDADTSDESVTVSLSATSTDSEYQGQTEMVSVTVTDTTPSLSSATVDGTSLVLTYDEPLDEGSVPAASAYSVSVGGGTAAAPSSVGVSGSTVILTLSAAVTSGQTATVTYMVPSTNPVQDAAGNDAAALTNQSVTNTTTLAAPVLGTASVASKTHDSASISVSISNADATSVYLQYKKDGDPGWTDAAAQTAASGATSVTFSLTGLVDATELPGAQFTDQSRHRQHDECNGDIHDIGCPCAGYGESRYSERGEQDSRVGIHQCEHLQRGRHVGVPAVQEDGRLHMDRRCGTDSGIGSYQCDFQPDLDPATNYQVRSSLTSPVTDSTANVTGTFTTSAVPALGTVSVTAKDHESATISVSIPTRMTRRCTCSTRRMTTPAGPTRGTDSGIGSYQCDFQPDGSGSRYQLPGAQFTDQSRHRQHGQRYGDFHDIGCPRAGHGERHSQGSRICNDKREHLQRGRHVGVPAVQEGWPTPAGPTRRHRQRHRELPV